MTISELLEQFITEQKFRNNSPRTIEWYSQGVNRFITWLGRDEISLLTLQNYRQYVIYLTSFKKADNTPYKSSTVNTYVRAVKGFYNYCIEENIVEDFSRRLRATKIRRDEEQVLTDEEIKKLLECDKNTCIYNRNRCIIALMLDSGLRRAEVTSLNVGDVDLVNNILLVNGKGNKQRFVPVGGLTHIFLSDYFASHRATARPSEPFFIDRLGNRLTVNAVKLLFQRLKTTANIPRLHAHLLRHTFATNYLVNGGDLETLRLILGHSSLTITELYLHMANNKRLLQDKHISHLDYLTELSGKKKKNRPLFSKGNGYQNSS